MIVHVGNDEGEAASLLSLLLLRIVPEIGAGVKRLNPYRRARPYLSRFGGTGCAAKTSLATKRQEK